MMLESFGRYLTSEGVLWDQSFALPSIIDIANSLDQSFIVDVRVVLLTDGKVPLYRLGEIFLKDRTADFDPNPHEHLIDEIKAHKLLLPQYLYETWGFRNFHIEPRFVELPFLARVGAWLFSEILPKDRNLEKLRKRLSDEAAQKRELDQFFRVLSLALHDELCLEKSVELESIGMFVPEIEPEKVVFYPDKYLLDCIAANFLSPKNSNIEIFGGQPDKLEEKELNERLSQDFDTYEKEFERDLRTYFAVGHKKAQS
jgi:hypothetical protein